MKKIILIIFLLTITSASLAQTRVSDFTEKTTAEDSLLIPVQTDSSGSYVWRKMQWSTIKQAINDSLKTWVLSDTTLQLTFSGNTIKMEVKENSLKLSKLNQIFQQGYSVSADSDSVFVSFGKTFNSPRVILTEKSSWGCYVEQSSIHPSYAFIKPKSYGIGSTVKFDLLIFEN